MLRCHALIPAFLVVAIQLMALDLSICKGRPGVIDPMTETEFQRELARIAVRSGIEATFRPCSERAVVKLHITESGSPEEPSALGSAVRKGGRIEPIITIFAGPIAQLVGTRLPYLHGVAMARIAAHELGHYLRQDSSHDRDGGIMSARLSGPKLIAPHDFRIALVPRPPE